MIILDTNIISETMRPLPDPAVIGWLDAQPWSELYLCAPVVAELNYGIARLEGSKRKDDLIASYRQAVDDAFEGRVLPFDVIAAETYGELVAQLEGEGNAIDVMDAMIAAIVLSNGATLVTRNTAHFKHTGVSLIDPFSTD
jgi:toxin FitB